jgi:hypothetical protein
MITQVCILAQVDLSTVEGQLSFLFERVASLEGAVALMLALAAAVFIIPRPRGFDIAACALLFVMSFPLHYTTLLSQQNTLVGPLQTLRSVSRPVSYALLAVVVLRSLTIPRGERSRATSFTAIAFYVFQMYYVLQLTLFDSVAKGLLAVVSVSGMMAVFASGFGREMQDRLSTRQALEVLGWLAVAFIGVNAIQLSLGFGSSFLGGRLLGTAGNAQFMGSVCFLLILSCCYLYNDLPRTRPLKWVCLWCIVVLAGFLVASGSRGNTLAAVVGLVVMFRRNIGQLAGIAIVGVVGIGIVASLLGEEATGSTRLLTGEDTRSAVWMSAFAVFQEYPLFGSLAVMGSDQPSFGVESSFIRSLALMGMVGGSLFFIAAGMMVLDVVHSMRLSRARPELSRMCDFHAALTVSILLLNTYEGIAFGVLTMSVMFMYLSFSLGGFLREQDVAAEARDGPQVEDGDGWATV